MSYINWRCHTPELFNRILELTNHSDIIIQPLNIFRKLLIEVGERCSEINDDKLNALMCRLTLYSISDPQDKDYNEKLLIKTLKKGDNLK